MKRKYLNKILVTNMLDTDSAMEQRGISSMLLLYRYMRFAASLGNPSLTDRLLRENDLVGLVGI